MQLRLIQQKLLRWLMRSSIVGMLTIVCVMSIFIQTTHAHSRSSDPPNFAQAACLAPGLSTFITGPNDFVADAEIHNDCPAGASGASGSAVLSTKITDCHGVGAGGTSNTFTFQVSPGHTFTQGFTGQAGCVVCVNHKPSSFPPFHVQITLSNIQGVFTYKGTVYRTGATPSSVSVTDLLGNNPPDFIPPCP
jgi:hypothetical protein